MDGGASKLRNLSDNGRRCRVARILCLVTEYLSHVEQCALFESNIINCLRRIVTDRPNNIEHYPLFDTQCERAPELC
jgi:hypothetical protein